VLSGKLLYHYIRTTPHSGKTVRNKT